MRRRRHPSPAIGRYSKVYSDLPPLRHARSTTFEQSKVGEESFHDPQLCPVCLDKFERDLKPPKLLPCGHSFCEGCLFSLCLHREYYLLETVKCPKCKSTFDANCAVNAPVNLDLCNLLEQTQSSQNITVIHVGGASQDSGFQQSLNANSKRSSKLLPFMELTRDKSGSSIFTAPTIALSDLSGKSPSTLSSLANTTSSSNASTSVEFVVDLQDNCRFCFDCRRYVDIKERAVLCRFCARCHGTAKKARLTCLECCVNRHNGHQLRPVEELESEQERFMNDLRLLQNQCQKFSQIFGSKLHFLTIQANGKGHSEFLALDQAQKLITHELNSCIQKAYARIQQEQLLHPNEIRLFRQKPFVLLARLQRLANLLEQAIKPKSANNLEPPCPMDQDEDRCVELRQTLQTLCTLVAFQSTSNSSKSEEEGSAFEDIRQYIVLLCSDECASATMRTDVLKSCVRALNSVLYGLNRPELLLLFEDAFLNCFICLNSLNPRRFGTPNPQREQIWKLVHTSFSEVLRLGGLQWLSANENRIQMVNDFARLCSLFGDVCDSSTVTLCTIEAVRARSAFANQPASERFGAVETQLQQIDEHLQEIRRVQKLAKICVRSRLKRRRQQPTWLSCFSPKIK